MKLRSLRTISLVTLAVLATVGVAVGQTGMDRLVTAAKQEGQLTTIALPHSWCNYGEVIAGFKEHFVRSGDQSARPETASPAAARKAAEPQPTAATA